MSLRRNIGVTWQAIGQVCGPMPRRLAGTFSARSGPNCFSTTRSSDPDVAVGDRVANLWLHQEPFLRGLAHLGFRAVGRIIDVGDVAPRSVIVWNDADGRAQHACFVAGEGGHSTRMHKGGKRPANFSRWRMW
jgi:hypothetical protein